MEDSRYHDDDDWNYDEPMFDIGLVKTEVPYADDPLELETEPSSDFVKRELQDEPVNPQSKIQRRRKTRKTLVYSKKRALEKKARRQALKNAQIKDCEDVKVERKEPKRRSKKESEETKTTKRKQQSQQGRNRKRKKRISEMTPEEQKIMRDIWRREKRNKRRQLKGHQQQQPRSELDDSIVKTETVMEDDVPKLPRGWQYLTLPDGTRRKKRVSEMTSDEQKVMRSQQRQRVKQYREKIRKENPSSLGKPRQPYVRTPEQKAKQAERRKMQRQLAKEGKLPPEEIARLEVQTRKDRERKAARRAAMSKEAKQEMIMKQNEYRKKKVVTLTEEQIVERRQKEHMRRITRKLTMTPEQKEKIRSRNRQKMARRSQAIGIEAMRERRRNHWNSMTPEKKAAALEQAKGYYRKKVERLQKAGMWEKYIQTQNEKRRFKREEERIMNGIATPLPRRKRNKNSSCTPQELEEKLRKRRRNYSTRARLNMAKTQVRKALSQQGVTSEEIDKRVEEYLQNSCPDQLRHMENLEKFRRARLRQRLKTQQLLASGMTLEEIRLQRETPEQRERRVLRARVVKAKSQLRKQLLAEGVSREEAERRVETLSEHLKVSTAPVRPYQAQKTTAERIINEKIVIPEPGSLADMEESLKDDPVTSQPETIVSPSPPKVTRKRSAAASKDHSKDIYPQIHTSTRSQNHSQSFRHPTSFHPAISVQQPCVPPATTHYPALSFQTTQGSAQPYSLSNQHQGFNMYPSIIASVGSQSNLAPQNPVANNYPLSSEMHAPTSQNNTYDPSPTSTQHEYGSSYYGDDNDNHSMASSEGDGTYDEYSNNSYNQPEESSQPNIPVRQAVDSSQQARQTRQRIRTVHAVDPNQPEQRGPRGGKIRPGRKYEYKPPKNPNAKLRTKQKDVVRDTVCDQCGQGFSSVSITAHRNQMHNPNYDRTNRICKICGEHFGWAQHWYSHYLNVHIRPNQATENTTYICDGCGKGFMKKLNLDNHIYYAHGAGSSKEKYFKCPLCPGDRFFKKKLYLYRHYTTAHPGYQGGSYECARCTETFRNELLLRDHIQQLHPESYFPCEWCPNVRYTDLARRFHHRRCPKIPKEQKKEYGKKNSEYYPDYFQISCELCKEKKVLHGLTLHYKLMHNVVEDRFKCFHCEKTFTLRGFWMVHIEEVHSQKLETFYDKVGLVNASKKDGMSVKPISHWGGRMEPRRKPEHSSDESDSGGKPAVEKKRRKIMVIAEEDEKIS